MKGFGKKNKTKKQTNSDILKEREDIQTKEYRERP